MIIEYNLKIKGENLPEFKDGFGEGVVMIQEVEFKGATEADLESPLFQRQIDDMGLQLMRECFEYKINIKK